MTISNKINEIVNLENKKNNNLNLERNEILQHLFKKLFKYNGFEFQKNYLKVSIREQAIYVQLTTDMESQYGASFLKITYVPHRFLVTKWLSEEEIYFTENGIEDMLIETIAKFLKGKQNDY